MMPMSVWQLHDSMETPARVAGDIDWIECTHSLITLLTPSHPHSSCHSSFIVVTYFAWLHFFVFCDIVITNTLLSYVVYMLRRCPTCWLWRPCSGTKCKVTIPAPRGAKDSKWLVAMQLGCSSQKHILLWKTRHPETRFLRWMGRTWATWPTFEAMELLRVTLVSLCEKTNLIQNKFLTCCANISLLCWRLACLFTRISHNVYIICVCVYSGIVSTLLNGV